MNSLIKYILKCRKQKELAQLLDINRQDLLFVSKETGQSLSHLAIYSGNDMLVYELINQKMFIDQPDNNGFYPFMYTFMYYKDFLEKIMLLSQKKMEYERITSISRIMGAAGYNTYYTGLSLENVYILLSRMLRNNFSKALLEHTKIIESKFGNDNSSISHLAAKFGYVDVLFNILQTKQYKKKEILEITNNKNQTVYDISRIYTPYLFPYLSLESEELPFVYNDLMIRGEEYKTKKAALFTFIDKKINKGVEKIFNEGKIKPYNAHAVLGEDFYDEEPPFIAYIINKNNKEAFDIALNYTDNLSEVFYENDIPKTIFTKALEKDKESGENIYSQIIEKYYPDFLRDISMKL